MNKTGQKFDMNPETFTLANVFAMELHRFQETIGEIVTCASKEMGIEKVGIKDSQFSLEKDLQNTICFFPKVYYCYVIKRLSSYDFEQLFSFYLLDGCYGNSLV